MLDLDRDLLSKALLYFAGALACILIAVLSGCGGAPADPISAGPRFVFRWKIVDYRAADPSTAPAISCTSAGAATVGLAWGLPQSSGGYQYPCRPEGEARTEPMRPGRYLIAAGLLDAREQVLQTISAGEQVLGQDGDHQLGRFVFVVRPL